jgi:ABC-2 type transport system permease protein
MSKPKVLQDLSYRSYGETVDYPVWWAIARAQTNINLRKKWIWLLTTMSAWWYLMIIIITWVFEQTIAQGGAAMGGRAPRFFENVVWRDQVAHAFGFGQMFVLFLTLVFAAGAISNDLRVNALLVYLSKPCTKRDYLLGKWLGTFLPLLICISIPHILFYIYGGLSFHTYGFFSQDPWMILRMIVALPLVAAFYTTFGLAISSLNRNGRIAGSVLAAIYFLSNFFTLAVVIAINVSQPMGQKVEVPKALNYLYYASIDGIASAVFRGVYAFSGSNWAFFGGGMAPGVPAISIFVALPVMLATVAVGILVAYRRIRAVEVIG